MSRPAPLIAASLVLALVIAVFGIVLVSWPDGSPFAVGVFALAIAVLPPKIVRFAFRGTPWLLTLRVLTIVEFSLGVVGAAVGIVTGAIVGSYVGIAAGGGVFVAGLLAAGLGALVYRAVERGVSQT